MSPRLARVRRHPSLTLLRALGLRVGIHHDLDLRARMLSAFVMSKSKRSLTLSRAIAFVEINPLHLSVSGIVLSESLQENAASMNDSKITQCRNGEPWKAEPAKGEGHAYTSIVRN